jgi:hypothetical protein
MPRPFEVARGRTVGCTALAALGLVVLALPRPARANGAFPESYQVVLPADRPNQIILATNFGLFISDDDGGTWTWSCEQPATKNGTLYSVSASPLDRLYSMSPVAGLAWSDDVSCTWTSSGGSLSTVLATDYWPDPTNSMRVFATGKLAADDTSPPRVVVSSDGGMTFGDPIYMAPAGQAISGFESAQSATGTFYLAAYTQPTPMTFHPFLERSTDGGMTWTETDLEAALGANSFRIIAVDPTDANVLTVRVIEETTESLAISRDGGQTFTKMFSIAGQLTAYVRLASGTILVAGALAVDGVGYRSMDDGMTFTAWTPLTASDAGVPDVGPDGGAPGPPHIRALAARGGKLYAAAKNYSDDWAIGVSTDDGVTFDRLAKYDDVSAIRPCVATTCLPSCQMQEAAEVFPMALCPSQPVEPPPEPPPQASTGCGCAIGSRRVAAVPAALAGCALAALCVARARRRR